MRLHARFWIGLFFPLSAAVAISMPMAVTAQTKPSARTIEVGEFTAPVEVSLKVGDTLRVVLASTPSTGYSWQAEGSSAILTATSSSNTPSTAGNVGAAGRQTLTFTAKMPGKDNLVLDYKRPWEKGKPPARQYPIDVTVSRAVAGKSASPVVIARSTLIGTYSGKLPCADCSALLTTIAFYAADTPQSPAGYYVRTSTYLGAPKGNVVSIDAGHCLFQKGTPDNPDQTVYSLQPASSGNLESYVLTGGDTLTPLGSDGKPIQAPFNLSLKKQP